MFRKIILCFTLFSSFRSSPCFSFLLANHIDIYQNQLEHHHKLDYRITVLLSAIVVFIFDIDIITPSITISYDYYYYIDTNLADGRMEMDKN